MPQRPALVLVVISSSYTRTDEVADESVGIATGMLLAAAQVAGLATLTHTPSPMKFLGEVLGRPSNERAYMLIPMGWPAIDGHEPVAALCKKPISEVMGKL